MENPNLHSFLSRLRSLEKHKDYWTACCPVHDDKHNSLSITPTDDGKILVNCHVGCKSQDIVYATGHTWSQMFPERVKQKESAKRMTETYDYFDEERVLAYQVCRMEWEEKGELKKTFLQRRPDGNGGFTWKTKGLKKILYRLPELLETPKDKPIFIVEGEKQVNYLCSLGLHATTNTNGAGGWLKSYGKLMTDRDVVVVPDADIPSPTTGKITGALHAVAVADSCLEYANTVHVLQLPNCSPKWGLDDWLQGGHTLEEMGKLLADCPQYPEGEIITEIKPDEEQDMEDPLKRFREIIEKIGITYCAHLDDGRTEVFATETRRFTVLPQRIRYEDLIAACGLIVIRQVSSSPEDNGDVSMNLMREAIAAVSSATPSIEDKRGQGCWPVDEGRIAIVNHGEMGILNGRPKLNRVVSPMLNDKAYAIGSSAHWIDFDLLEEDLESKPGELYQDELTAMVDLIDQWNFRYPEYRQPEMIVGLMLASITQACWSLRPQVFLIGQSYSGKTTMMQLIEKVLGCICRRFSQPSAAGLRSFIKQTAKIVLLDEVEKSRYRREVFEMIRASARGDSVIRGSASQESREFSINNIFWCSAIEPGLEDEADKTRFITIELERATSKPDWPSSDKLAEMGNRLCRLAICSFREASRIVKLFAENPYSEAHGRLNECFGIPAAAYAAARGLNDADAVLLFHSFMRAVEMDEEIENDHTILLGDIMDGQIRKSTGNEFMAVHACLEGTWDDSTLAQNGIAKDVEYHYFNRDLLRKFVLRDERWKGVRIDVLLLRFDGAFRKPKRLGASIRQCVAIPNEVVRSALEKKKDDPTEFNPFSPV